LELEEVACSLGELHPVFQHALPRDLSNHHIIVQDD